MPSFKHIDNIDSINLSDKWTDSIKFNSKGRVVGENGKPLSSNYKGRQYRLISKKERAFSSAEKIGRGFLGVAAIVFSLGIALIFKPVRNLFSKKKAKIRFAVVNHLSPNPVVGSTNQSQVNRENTVDLKPREQKKMVVGQKGKPSVNSSANTEKKVDGSVSEQELQRGVVISEDTILKIQTCMKDVLGSKEEGGIKLYNSQGNHRVFSLETAPEYIFKMKANKNCSTLGKDDSMKARYQTMIKAQTVCSTHQLGLLVIPNAKLLTVEANGEKYDIIAERKVDINPNESGQEQYYQDYAGSLNETIRQLAVFICKTGYSDVEWRNNPILNNSLDEFGQRKIALIDLEEMDSKTTGLFGGGWGRRGLVRCVTEEQGKIVEKVAKENRVSISSFSSAYARRKEELEEGNRLKEYYATKNITAGSELVQIDVKALDFSTYPEKTEELKDVTLKLVEAINEKILKSSSEESVKGRRYIYINTNNGSLYRMDNKLIEPGENEFKTANAFKTDEEYHNATFLGHVVKKLADLGAIYKLINRNGHGYFIQA